MGGVYRGGEETGNAAGAAKCGVSLQHSDHGILLCQLGLEAA